MCPLFPSLKPSFSSFNDLEIIAWLELVLERRRLSISFFLVSERQLGFNIVTKKKECWRCAKFRWQHLSTILTDRIRKQWISIQGASFRGSRFSLSVINSECCTLLKTGNWIYPLFLLNGMSGFGSAAFDISLRISIAHVQSCASNCSVLGMRSRIGHKFVASEL